MARIKIRSRVYDSNNNGSHSTRIQIRAGGQLASVNLNAQYLIDNSNTEPVRNLYDTRTVECFDGYVDNSQLCNIVISGSSGLIGTANSSHPQQGSDYKMNILSKYLRITNSNESAVFILSGQGSNSVSAYEVFRPLVCTQDNAYYTPLAIDEYINFMNNEYDKYCESRRISCNSDMLSVLIRMMSINNRSINELYRTVAELLDSINSAVNQNIIDESYASFARSMARNNMDDFRIAKGFLKHYYLVLKDFLHPSIGGRSGYNTKILNSGLAFQVKLRPMSSSSITDSENIEYNRILSRLLRYDFSTNFNTLNTVRRKLIVVLDHLSYEQAELFAWIWNNDSSWLKHQEQIFILCLQEEYSKQMMRCTDFDGKIQKWYYLNHSDGRDLESLLGETIVYNTATDEHTDYGGLISVNRILKIPTGRGRHTVPTYRPRHTRTFFQELSPGEGLLRVKGQEKTHQFKCISNS